MKMSEVKALQTGDTVIHTRYGESKIVKLEWSFDELFGIIVRPDNEMGKVLLAADSGTTIPDFLEDSVRRIKPIRQKKNKETAGEQSGEAPVQQTKVTKCPEYISNEPCAWDKDKNVYCGFSVPCVVNHRDTQ